MTVYSAVKVWRAFNPDKVCEQARRYRARYPDRNAIARAKYRAAHLEECRRKDREYQRRKRGQ
jgi:hypothetical protein